MIKASENKNLKINITQNRTKKGRKTIVAIENIDKELMPKHIAIIMDGNRRWAKEKKLPVKFRTQKRCRNFRKYYKICQ